MIDSQTPSSTPNTDASIAELSYEDARSRLVDIVSELERGSLPLETAIAYWEKGEALARHCQKLLDGARERLAPSDKTDRSTA